MATRTEAISKAIKEIEAASGQIFRSYHYPAIHAILTRLAEGAPETREREVKGGWKIESGFGAFKVYDCGNRLRASFYGPTAKEDADAFATGGGGTR